MENKYKKKYIFERVSMVGIFVYKSGVFNLLYDINGTSSCRNTPLKYIHVIFSMVNCLPNKCSAEMRK